MVEEPHLRCTPEVGLDNLNLTIPNRTEYWRNRDRQHRRLRYDEDEEGIAWIPDVEEVEQTDSD